MFQMKRHSPVISCALLLFCFAIVATFFVVERELHTHSHPIAVTINDRKPSSGRNSINEDTPKRYTKDSKDTSKRNTEDRLPINISPIDNPLQKSRWAYVTLISGINEKLAYRGFLYNAIIMYHSLKKQGSTADFIAMIGYNFPMKSKQDPSFQSSPYYTKDNLDIVNDLNLLKSHGIIVYELPRLLNAEKYNLYMPSFCETFKGRRCCFFD